MLLWEFACGLGYLEIQVIWAIKRGVKKSVVVQNISSLLLNEDHFSKDMNIKTIYN